MQQSTIIAVCLLIAVPLVRCCEKITFVHSMVGASKSSGVVEDDIIPVTMVNGCLEPGTGLEEALRIAVVNASVPVIYEGAVKDLTNLQILNLDFDGIKEITPGAFQNLPSLRVLTLVGNKIKLIKEGVFNGLGITHLRLSNNSINAIEPGAFNDMPNLKVVEADFNKISVWNPSWFTNSPNVVRLSFTHNKITSLPPYAFQNIKGSQYFGANPIPTSIFLSNNKIILIDSMAFQGLEQIGYLNLAENSIVSLPPNAFSSLKKIGGLFLDGNKIKCLGEAFLNSLPPVDYVSINKNPWDCTCLEVVKSWSKMHGNVIDTQIANMECSVKNMELLNKKMKGIMDFVGNIKQWKSQFATMKYPSEAQATTPGSQPLPWSS